jgi:hypothetical protein
MPAWGHERKALRRALSSATASDSDSEFVGDPHQQRYDSFLSRFRSFLGEQSEAAEARMALAADHQMVVDGDAQRLGRRFDLARHLDVVARGLGIT